MMQYPSSVGEQTQSCHEVEKYWDAVLYFGSFGYFDEMLSLLDTHPLSRRDIQMALDQHSARVWFMKAINLLKSFPRITPTVPESAFSNQRKLWAERTSEVGMGFVESGVGLVAAGERILLFHKSKVAYIRQSMRTEVPRKEMEIFTSTLGYQVLDSIVVFYFPPLVH